MTSTITLPTNTVKYENYSNPIYLDFNIGQQGTTMPDEHMVYLNCVNSETNTDSYDEMTGFVDIKQMTIPNYGEMAAYINIKETPSTSNYADGSEFVEINEAPSYLNNTMLNYSNVNVEQIEEIDPTQIHQIPDYNESTLLGQIIYVQDDNDNSQNQIIILKPHRTKLDLQNASLNENIQLQSQNITAVKTKQRKRKQQLQVRPMLQDDQIVLVSESNNESEMMRSPESTMHSYTSPKICDFQDRNSSTPVRPSKLLFDQSKVKRVFSKKNYYEKDNMENDFSVTQRGSKDYDSDSDYMDKDQLLKCIYCKSYFKTSRSLTIHQKRCKPIQPIFNDDNSLKFYQKKIEKIDASMRLEKSKRRSSNKENLNECGSKELKSIASEAVVNVRKLSLRNMTNKNYTK